MQQLRATGDKLIVKAINEKPMAWSIILDTRTDLPCHWVVVAVGPGRFLENGTREIMDVTEGDEVYFTRYTPDMFEIEDQEYYAIKQSSLLAILPKQ